MSAPSPFDRPMDAPRGTYADDPTDEEVRALYEQYVAEGHMIYLNDFHEYLNDPGNSRDDLAYIATCTCGDSSGTTPEGIANNDPAMLRTAEACRMWARQHREDHGLEWQQWLGSRHAELTWHRVHELQGHGVCADEVPKKDGSTGWIVVCSCAIDHESEGLRPESTTNADTEDEATWWAAEHRASHGLEPQRFLPPLGALTMD